MKSLWNDDDAAAAVREWAAAGEDLALRVYTSRLIGSDPSLVLHGGGNTSVKTRVRDLDGSDLEVLCVKGSGWDLGDIEPPGLPAVELEPLRRLRGVKRLRDRDMVNQVRRRLLDSAAPNPSVETLLHAFLPHKFVDHTHADAIVTLTNQPDGEALVREALGARIAVLPWIMPGFPLAVAVADAFEANPDVDGIVLLQHGIFTFGENARESYERMIELVDRAERFIEDRVGAVPAMLDPVVGGALCGDAAERDAFLAEALPVLRGAMALQLDQGNPSSARRLITECRTDDDLVAFSVHPDAAGLVAKGPLTPDHVIRTKGRYLYLTRAQATDPDACRAAVQDYVGWYLGYVKAAREAHGLAEGGALGALVPPTPVVALIEGVGLVATGASRKAARIAADIAQHTLRAKARGQALGTYVDLPAADLYEMEYWPLELAKLGKKVPPALAGQVALVTGAAGAIGCGIAAALLEAGAHVVATDVDGERLEVVRARLAAMGPLETVVADVTDEADVRRLFRSAALQFGGVDIVVPNAGVAHVATLAEMEPEAFRRVLDVNTTGTMLVLKEAARVFGAQRTGGSVVVQGSKNVPAPGAAFGAYSASKAAATQLARIAALELAPLGVRVNTVHADAVFGDGEVPSQLWETVGPDRMKARGLDPEGLRAYYRDRSLLKQTVTPAHVGAAVVFFASAQTPTTGATLAVDGGVAEAFPR